MIALSSCQLCCWLETMGLCHSDMGTFRQNIILPSLNNHPDAIVRGSLCMDLSQSARSHWQDRFTIAMNPNSPRHNELTHDRTGGILQSQVIDPRVES